jgi:hypothetical protein
LNNRLRYTASDEESVWFSATMRKNILYFALAFVKSASVCMRLIRGLEEKIFENLEKTIVENKAR